jgi:hypothetical protein
MSKFNTGTDLEDNLSLNLAGGPALAGGEERTEAGLIIPKGVVAGNNLGNKANVVARAEDFVANQRVEKTEKIEKTEVVLSPEQEKVAESLREQIGVSLKAYTEVSSWLGLDPEEVGTKEEVSAHLEEQIKKWATAGALDYLAEVMERQEGQEFVLGVVPNKVVSKDKLKDGFRAFGEDQPYGTRLWEGKIDKYSDEELSGEPAANDLPFRVVLVPAKITKEVFDIDRAKAGLEKEQSNCSVARDLTPLEGLCFIEQMRTRFRREHGRSKDFVGSKENGYLYTRYSSLPVRGGYVLFSVVNDDGQLNWDDSDASNRNEARWAVGF